MNKLTSLIAKHEGRRLKPYLDSVGVWTVGYGHNCQDAPITQRVAEMLLEDDVQDAIHDCQTFNWFGGLNEVRTAVIVNMVFNLGLTRFSKFKKTIGFIELNEWEMASVEMLNSKWAIQVGSRSDDLSFMMATGEW
ncbi:MAG: lysozyme [Betaproteobacteria bacterium]|nr:lysozyme [Betaproteobacteria bacterium]